MIALQLPEPGDNGRSTVQEDVMKITSFDDNEDPGSSVFGKSNWSNKSRISDQVEIKSMSKTGLSDPSNDMLPLIKACSIMYNEKLYLIGGTGSRQFIEITGCTTTQRGILVPRGGSQNEIFIEDAICTSSTKGNISKSKKSSDGFLTIIV